MAEKTRADAVRRRGGRRRQGGEASVAGGTVEEVADAELVGGEESE